jgi:hypothetical protein
MKTIREAQADMRDAYYDGATGAFASATAWLGAALVTSWADARSGILTLIFAGMFIFPASLVLAKAFGRSGKHAKDNPLAPLAIYGTVWMILCIIIAFALSFQRPEWFFPAMLLVIGGRYLTFETLYGLKIYLAFAATLILAAFGLVALQAPVQSGAYTGALIEYLFAIALFLAAKKRAAQAVQ